MPFIESWDVFYQRAEDLFRAEPLRTRCVTKYRHCDGKLEIKVTDDRECLKFKTDQAQDLKRLEKLSQLVFTISVHGEQAEVADYLPESTLPAGQAPSKGTKSQQDQAHGGKSKRSRRQ